MADSILVEVCLTRGDREHVTLASFAPGSIAGRIVCRECSGTGWWGFGPIEDVNGPCIDCKGTGRVWVGLT